MRTSLSLVLVLVSVAASCTSKNEGLSMGLPDATVSPGAGADAGADAGAPPRRGSGGGPLVGCAEALSPCPPVASGFKCVDLASDPRNCGACGPTCGGKMFCATGTCRCPAEEQICGGACANLRTDPQNCGK